jgi:DNA primase
MPDSEILTCLNLMSKSHAYIDFAEVKAAGSLEKILNHYGLMPTLKRSGSESLRGCCPIHKGTSPEQFSVTLSKNAWKCFSECQRGGNQLDFVTRMENCTLHEAAWKVNEWFGLGLEKKVAQSAKKSRTRNPEVKTALEDHPPTAENRNAGNSRPSDSRQSEKTTQEETGENPPLAFTLRDLDCQHPYLSDRGLALETITEFGLGHCPKGIMAGRIGIPIHNADGKIVAYAGRWPGAPPEGKEKYRLPAGFKKSLEMYNIHRALAESAANPLVVVEGFFDVMRLWQLGIRRVIAIMGTNLSDAQEEMIREALQEDDKVLLSLDDDEAGQNATPAILNRIARFAFVRVVAADILTRTLPTV